ncbi:MULTISPECIES: PAS domain S-box protein [unclassified Anabaena]|uniref:PAS domain S-box protein n=1 Tax=unclassified Anabaena TaxID=2619674 RepID=UPI0039C6499B
MPDVNRNNSEFTNELASLRQRIAELEASEIEHQQKYTALEQKLKILEAKLATAEQPHIQVAGCDIQWNLDEGTCKALNLPVVLMWRDTTLAGFMTGLQAMVGTERFALALQSEGRRSVEADWQIIAQFPDFAAGFAMLAQNAKGAGWGHWQLVELNWEEQKCRFRVKNSWEGAYQKALGVCWGSGMMAGKLAGYCSKLFATNCWSQQTSFIANGDEFDEFIVSPSTESLETEIANLLLTDQATRADMAVALQQLQKEIQERQQVEIALRESEERLRLALDAARMGFWDWNMINNQLIWSENHQLLFGLVPGSFVGTYEAFIKYIHPEDQQSVQQKITNALAQKIDYIDEFRVIWPDQSVHWIFGRGQFIYNDQGEAVRMIGVCTDFTQHKQSEESNRQLTTKVQEQANVLNAILATSVDHIYIFDRRGRYQYVSDGAATTLGFNNQDILGKAIKELDVDPDLAHRVENQCQIVMATGQPIKDECEFSFADGSNFYEYIITALRNTDQIIEGVIIVSRDITIHKQIEKSLRDSEARFRRLFESNLLGVAFWNVDGLITDANDAYLQIIGYTREEFSRLGKINWRQLTPPEYQDVDDGAIAEVTATGVSPIYEKEYIQRHGKRVSVVLGLALFNDSQDNGVALVLDISDRKQAEKERDLLLQREQSARQEAEIANRVKDQFLAVLSHELRTPLNPILGWSRLLRCRQFDPKIMEIALETIERNAKLQTQLIEDLLDVSRILQGKLSLNICPVNLVMVVEAAVETVKLAANARSIEIQTILNPGLRQVMGDSSRLQQVVWNLLSNAVKFTPIGGRVEVRLEEVDSQAQIQVIDTGKGITPEFLADVFDYFRQADSTTTRKFGGLGLGLAIVRQVVELHGGTVTAASPGEGLGATFTVRLPFLLRSVEVMYPDNNAELLMADASLVAGIKVLVVDDEPDIRDLISFILQEYDVKVTTVSSAQEALETLSQWIPDVLISDIGMPETDGYMLMRELRKRSPEQGGNLPAIALTAYAGEMNQQQAFAAGFQLHIPKPVDPDELMRAICFASVLRYR